MSLLLLVCAAAAAVTADAAASTGRQQQFMPLFVAMEVSQHRRVFVVMEVLHLLSPSWGGVCPWGAISGGRGGCEVAGVAKSRGARGRKARIATDL